MVNLNIQTSLMFHTKSFASLLFYDSSIKSYQIETGRLIEMFQEVHLCLLSNSSALGYNSSQATIRSSFKNKISIEIKKKSRKNIFPETSIATIADKIVSLSGEYGHANDQVEEEVKK